MLYTGTRGPMVSIKAMCPPLIPEREKAVKRMEEESVLIQGHLKEKAR